MEYQQRHSWGGQVATSHSLGVNEKIVILRGGNCNLFNNLSHKFTQKRMIEVLNLVHRGDFDDYKKWLRFQMDI